MLLAQDASLADIEAATGVSITTIRRGGFTTPVKRQRDEDEVSTPTPEVKGRRKLVKKYHKKNRRATSQDIVWKLAQENEIFVSKRTVARDQVALGGNHLTCERVQRLNDVQKENRLNWCKKLLKEHPQDDEFWKLIVFSDETKRGTSDMDMTAWVLPGEQRPQREEQRWDCKILVWG